jgi:hypothetical protein
VTCTRPVCEQSAITGDRGEAHVLITDVGRTIHAAETVR